MIRRESTGIDIPAKVREASGIRDLTFHMCRRTFATLFQGDVQDLQCMLGHYDLAITMERHKKAVPDRQRQAVEELDRRVQLNDSEPRVMVN